MIHIGQSASSVSEFQSPSSVFIKEEHVDSETPGDTFKITFYNVRDLQNTVTYVLNQRDRSTSPTDPLDQHHGPFRPAPRTL
ncbi:hypothetical protein KUCAC02_032767 [Chaenocephalus aceratus]|nr:hypothetical protein KUCAC02_033296 [Chaenocephalus aceratus]KAI4793380.1 hypothetical protein KUCAC02_032767 [Chaenocephalus aceratus]